MRLLVVEDEPRLLRNLAKALREEGYAVDTADGGDDGLFKAESGNYDAIIEYLALHRGEVVTRTELYEHLFDESDDTLSNLVDVHVFSIRKKLRPDLITTRRGQGYCIER